ncbi:MAG: GNAT family N-acetyltransferase [Micavibrio aeruginosavorus]|uniref:GNAT family N-acetyltransferase n=1 Tax=Micavibrio aeruginosavorus TaxID=349221 RepID=A0A7T5UHS8_9BACT|nr:MAG: GNAT family N-acetyltransferase [Micavibrio aeruginosavorus]
MSDMQESLQGSDIPSLQDFNLASGAYRMVLLGIDDVPCMVALQDRTGCENIVPRTIDYYYTHLFTGQCALGIRDSEGVLVAQGLIKCDGGGSLIQNVLVDPAHRGQKLSSRLITQWLELLKESGIGFAQARVRIDNHSSLHNFLACGMDITQTIPSPEDPRYMVHVLTKVVKDGFAPQ